MEAIPVRGRCIVLIGPMFSGKTYYVKEHFQEWEIVSYRLLEQAATTIPLRDENALFLSMDLLVRSIMIQGKDVVIDDKNLELESLFFWKGVCARFDYSYEAIVFDTPMSVCKERIEKHYEKIPQIVPGHLQALGREYEKFVELKTVLGMKYQSIFDNLQFIKVGG